MYRGLIAAAGLSPRLQDLGESRNTVLADLGGESILSTILTSFDQCGVADPIVVAGPDCLAVRLACADRARCLLNPFLEHSGVVGSIWLARQFLDGEPFVFTTEDRYFAMPRFEAFLADRPKADVLVDGDLKIGDEEGLRASRNAGGKLCPRTRTFLKDPLLGEFTGAVRFSAKGSRRLFDALEKYMWKHGVHGRLADVLRAVHRKWELVFHLSSDRRRIDVDFPHDLTRTRQPYAADQPESRLTA